MRKDYLVQARLMLRLLPHVAAEECFALKGGTPINFFVWDMPRLSVDIDLTPEVRKAFLVYLISHDRPMHEVIEPTRKDVRATFESEFKEMTDEPVVYETLVDARERLITQLKKDLADAEKRFLLSVKDGKPEWPLLGLNGVEKLPAVQWKLKNIGKMAPAKQQEQLAKLRAKLGL